MNHVTALRRLFANEDINFLVTNRIPRIAVTRAMGWVSGIRNPLVARAGIGLWRLFTDLDLSEARKRRFDSLHDCFTRELRVGARPVDPDPRVLTSPSDGIVGACGPVAGTVAFQAKGFPYSIHDLFGARFNATPFLDGIFVTLRLTSAMYHRFHAPYDCRVEHVTYHSGDTWNVNPVALSRVERLFCRNERAVLRVRLAGSGAPIAIVPVAAIMVASIRLHFLDVLLHLGYRGAHELPCDAQLARGEEMGWFQHGSTIIVFAPRGFALAPGVRTGHRIRMGEPLLGLPPGASTGQPPEAAGQT